MSALLLPFAKRISTGEYVSPEEVERGRACNCVCPGCNSEVIAKQGTERVWHFSHSKSEKCSNGYEISIHELAKQLLRQKKELLLPSLTASVVGRDAFGFRLEVQEPVLQGHLVKLDECKSGVILGGVNVDVLGLLNGHEILIEITVFHRLMPDKQDRIVATGIPSLQINLDRFKTMQATKGLLEKELFENENIRRWIFHPRLNEALVKAQAKLDWQLKERKDLWDKEQELRKKDTAKIIPVIKDANWNSVFGSTFEGNLGSRGKLQFRAFLPTSEQVALAATSLAERTGLSEVTIRAVTSTITNRSQLRDYTPDGFVRSWSEQLNLPLKEVEIFLIEAGYARYF